jgi:hypothetical protein
MRHAVRIQPYVSADLFGKLRAYSAARSLTTSAVICAALTEYFERDEVEESLLVRRLDGVTNAVGQLQRDLDTLSAALGRFVRYSFWTAPLQVDDKVVRRADGLYRDFLSKVGEQVRAGITFSRQVFPPRRSPAAPVAPTGPESGSRNEGGRS